MRTPARALCLSHICKHRHLPFSQHLMQLSWYESLTSAPLLRVDTTPRRDGRAVSEISGGSATACVTAVYGNVRRCTGDTAIARLKRVLQLAFRIRIRSDPDPRMLRVNNGRSDQADQMYPDSAEQCRCGFAASALRLSHNQRCRRTKRISARNCPLITILKF
jgi:hypothetical protein